MEHQRGMFAMVEGAAMEAFLNAKHIPGENLKDKVDNYCQLYNVPVHICTLMHDIRKNRNVVAHGQGSLVELDYISADMKAYQSYYYEAKGKPGRTATVNIDWAHGSVELVKKSHHQDWICTDPSCGFNNFAGRTACFKCGREKPPAQQALAAFAVSVRPGDWICSNPNCGINNFADRTVCFKCGRDKIHPSQQQQPQQQQPQVQLSPTNPFAHAFLHAAPPVLSAPAPAPQPAAPAAAFLKPGDWICSNATCGFNNFADRTVCFKCGGARAQIQPSQPQPAPKSTDWICLACGFNNFADRIACFKCSSSIKAPKQPQTLPASTPAPAAAPVPALVGGPRRTDWICPTCGINNFADRLACFKCARSSQPAIVVAAENQMRPGDWICSDSSCGAQNFAIREKCFKCNKPRQL